MFDYVKRHKITLAKSIGFVGGLHVARKYISDRLEEVRESMEVERAAKDSLRRRFQQTQEDTSYTILALLPTLSEQILQAMDVEALTKELQARSRARNPVLAPTPSYLAPGLAIFLHEQPQPEPERAPSSLASSIDIVHPNPLHEEDMHSDVDSVALSHNSDDIHPAPSQMSDSFASASASVTQSWVESSGSGSREGHSPIPSASAVVPESSDDKGDGNSERRSETGSGVGHEPLSESILSNLTSTTASSAVSDSSDTRTKAELWNEVKMLTFTRTLTTLYSTTLLCLLSTIQVTLLARSKYVAAVLQQEREERLRERIEAELSMANLLMQGMGLNGGTGAGLERLLSGAGLDEEGNEDFESSEGFAVKDGLWSTEGISGEAENKYLTMSWWLLHVGWKDVRERVRRGVEEVFNGVSLKTKLAAVDLHRLISDVRRRVEHEITFEGTEKRTNFLSSLLPSTAETIQLVLLQGGYTSSFTEPYYPSDAIESSLSVGSSQISYNFVNSPALAVSTTQTRIQRHPRQGQPSYLPPPPPLPHAHLLDEPFASLMAETRGVLASPDFARVLEVCLDRATEVLFSGLEKNVFGPSGAIAGGSGGFGEELVRIRLAGLLPGLAKWSQLALDGLPNELIDNILDLREVSCLSAIVFARFEQQFQ